MGWWAVLILGWAIFAVWLVALGPATLMMLLRTPSRVARSLPDPPEWPSVTVVVPARDEAADIEAALRSILASDYPRLEVVAVNDRSSDATGEIMDRLARDDSRLTTMHVDDLPPGWLGKNHAMHAATRSADSEWILFTDADVIFSPDAIRLGITYVCNRSLDHLCLAPKLLPGGYWENALISFFGVMFAVGAQPWLARTPWRFSYVGVGAYNLVRREAYEAVGGYETLRLDVLDDMKIGKLLKFSGFRQDMLRSSGQISVRWQPSAWGVIRGLEKNAFASINYSVGMLLFVTAVLAVLLAWPYVAVAWFRDARAVGYVAALVLLHGLYAVMGKAFSSDWRVFPVLPIAGAALLLAFWRSAILALRQGGVRWRETFYSLSELRKHQFHRPAEPAAEDRRLG